MLGALGAGCGQHATPAWDGGWVDAAHERGHLLRPDASTSAGSTAASRGAKAAAPQRCSVAIVGAGVAGLAAARALLSAGIDDLRVFELEDEAGGNARGHVMGGMACPLGAHYLPLPGPQAHEVAELLHELGLLRHELGRTLADERHLCHSPQERLWRAGLWTEGLLPHAEPGSAAQAQYQRFAGLVADTSRRLAFALPSRRAGWTAGHAALDAIPFADWLGRQGLDDPGLRWYLDYACRDDYGAGSASVSAWAGLHYFASRHGFQAPGGAGGGRGGDLDDGGHDVGVFTWPEGNAWLTHRLAAPLGKARLRTGAVVRRVEALRHGVEIELWNVQHEQAERWLAQQVVVALPLPVAMRVVARPPVALVHAAAGVTHAPWLVANLQLDSPLTDKPGAPPSWDNVLQGGAAAALGYVDAMHQSTRPVAGPTVLTAYWALGDGDRASVARQRSALLGEPWRVWADRVVADLARAHPDLPHKLARVDLMRYGHAMSIPAPGVRGSAALAALAAPQPGRIQYAHADLAGYSVFEEAYTLGIAAGRTAAARLRSG
jgi:predicted NAD/FAD-dependent oxidoreductase